MTVIFQTPRRFALVALLLFATPTLASLTSCAPKSTTPQLDQETLEKTVRPVKIFKVEPSDQVETLSFPLVLKSGATTKPSFRIPGKLVELNVAVGQRVTEGEVLAKLDARDYQLAVERVQQSLVEARAGLKAMQTGARLEDVASLEAALEAARSQHETARKQFERITSLHTDAHGARRGAGGGTRGGKEPRKSAQRLPRRRN